MMLNCEALWATFHACVYAFFHAWKVLHAIFVHSFSNEHLLRCTPQSSCSPKCWALCFFLIFTVSPAWHFSFFLLHFLRTPITNSSDRDHFSSFKRINEYKKARRNAAQEASVPLIHEGWEFDGPASLSSLHACSFPSTLMENCSRLTVTPSSHQEWLIMVLNIDPCLTCVKIPPTLN